MFRQNPTPSAPSRRSHSPHTREACLLPASADAPPRSLPRTLPLLVSPSLTGAPRRPFGRRSVADSELIFLCSRSESPQIPHGAADRGAPPRTAVTRGAPRRTPPITPAAIMEAAENNPDDRPLWNHVNILEV
ncbi:hypothetical protein U9M48_012193 [Paspalum notatum var. saurae]|uniref:Uncharacterized protein n=1 Tax=Paspalum notatum var. saurae TaxID=547442 RepID=A0AAQ3WIF5_PASNO